MLQIFCDDLYLCYKGLRFRDSAGSTKGVKMPKRNIPNYRLHKASGQAVVELDGRTFYLGKHGSKAMSWDFWAFEQISLGSVCRL